MILEREATERLPFDFYSTILGRDKKYRVRNALNAHKLMVGPAIFYDVVLEGPNILHNLVEFKAIGCIPRYLWYVMGCERHRLSRPLMEESRHAGVGFEYVFYTVVSVLFTLVLPCTVS